MNSYLLFQKEPFYRTGTWTQLFSVCAPLLNHSYSKVTNLVLWLIQNISTPLYCLPSICSMSLNDNLTSIVSLAWSVSHLPRSILVSLITNVSPHQSFLRTNPKYIPACQKNCPCVARWGCCDIVLPSSWVSNLSQPLYRHTMRHMYLQPGHKLAYIAIVIVGRGQC